MSDVLKPSRKTPPPEMAALSPPLSPKSEKQQLNEKSDLSEVPADINIPDNYVQYTLKHTKPKPPVTWDNFWSELNYINVAVLTVTPGIAIWGLVSGVPLRWQTVLFSIFYYYVTGLGITAGALLCPIFYWSVLKRLSNLKVIIAFGRTGHIMHPNRWNISSLLPELVRWKALSNGGLVVTAHTTVIPTPISTRTVRTRGSGGHTSGGCLSNLVASLVLQTSPISAGMASFGGSTSGTSPCSSSWVLSCPHSFPGFCGAIGLAGMSTRVLFV